ncbi:uncharacterized protein F5891DRAFT_916268, partial [Suillus fuscotomentosus]
PGEEGIDLSHEGGEYEAFTGLSHQITSLSGCCYVDPCTHHDRIEIQTGNCNSQLDILIDAYLDHHARDKGNGMPSLLTGVMLNGHDCLFLADIELVDICS